MITKERLIKEISKFPDRLDIDELIERLLFINKVENRLAMSNSDDTISEEELEKEIAKWSK
jgi:hypothetical protein